VIYPVFSPCYTQYNRLSLFTARELKDRVRLREPRGIMSVQGEQDLREATTSSLRQGVSTDLETASIVCLLSIMDSIDQHEPTGEGRCRRIALHAVATARAMLQPSNVIDTVRLSALFCNIGMVTVPEELVNKNGPLSDLEWQLIQQHPLRSTEILAALPHLRDVLPGVLHHHENWQGDGYPHRFSGDQIPLAARIIRVADTYEALTSLRPYRPPTPPTRRSSSWSRGWTCSSTRASSRPSSASWSGCRVAMTCWSTGRRSRARPGCSA
jgi:HD-GYP domain-containing protein (c-di-GMP phosphodiesterase class II)